MKLNKEQIYDKEIFSLMEKILEVCKEHKIAMLADFQLDSNEPSLHATSGLLLDEYKPSQRMLKAWNYIKPQ